MITFLPEATYSRCARILDTKRLGSQRREALIILNGILNETRKYYKNYNMWVGYEGSLCEYGLAMCNEWVKRGYYDTLMNEFAKVLKDFPNDIPWWLGNEKLHSNHRGNLIRKDAIYYGNFGWSENPMAFYIYPKGKSERGVWC